MNERDLNHSSREHKMFYIHMSFSPPSQPRCNDTRLCSNKFYHSSRQSISWAVSENRRPVQIVYWTE